MKDSGEHITIPLPTSKGLRTLPRTPLKVIRLFPGLWGGLGCFWGTSTPPPRSSVTSYQASVGTYREFVVFEAAQIYPEYVMLYEREY